MTAPKLFVTADELGEVMGISGGAVRRLVKRNRLDHTRGARQAMRFTRLQIVGVLKAQGVPNLDAVEMASEVTGMPRSRGTKAPKAESTPKPKPKPSQSVTPSPAPDWATPPQPANPDPFRTTARSRAAHRKTA